MRVFGNLMNRIQEGPYPPPKVGDGATVLMHSDRYPATVIEVLSPKRVRIQEDTATRTDKNGMSESQEYTYEPNPNGRTYIVSLRMSGRWIVVGEGMNNGTAVAFGKRDKYHDFSF